MFLSASPTQTNLPKSVLQQTQPPREETKESEIQWRVCVGLSLLPGYLCI